MKSKLSYFKLCREELRHQTALIIVSVFAFLIQSVAFVLSAQNKIAEVEMLKSQSMPWSSYYGDVYQELAHMCQPQYELCLVAIGLAIYSAFYGFRFLHSKKQMDFYGALPITRRYKFAVISSVQIAIFVIGAILTTAAKIIAIYATKYNSAMAIENLLYSMLCNILVFLVVWAFAVLAMVLTGHVFVAFLGFGVFALYAPVVLRGLIPGYMASFFETYTFSQWDTEVWNYFSPITIAYKMVGNYGYWAAEEAKKWMLISVFAAVLVILLAYILFLKRPSEAAGRAMVFAKMKRPLKIMLVVPMALYAGLYFYLLSFDKSKSWMIIGILGGVCLFHVIIEWIYEFNIRASFSHKRDIVAALVCCFLYVLFFWMDIGGHDTFVPRVNETKSVMVYTIHMDINPDIEKSKKTPQMSQELLKDAIAFAEHVVDEQITEDESHNSMWENINIIYVMKDGNIEWRNYKVPQGFDYSLFDECYAKKEYKSALYRVFDMKGSEVKIQFYDENGGGITSETIMIEEEKEQFLKLYQEEFAQLSYEEVEMGDSVLKMQINLENGKFEFYDIYPSFEKTITFLKEQGVPEIYFD